MIKSFITLSFILFSICASAKTYRLRQLDDMQEKIDALTSRVEKLESQVSRLKSAPNTDPASGLKVIDKKNSSMGATSNSSARSISSTQQAEMMKQIKNFKKNQEERQKLLDELMEE